jgi:hypothetical protein
MLLYNVYSGNVKGKYGEHTDASKTLKYDIKLTDPNGNESYYMKGNLNVSEGYTA